MRRYTTLFAAAIAKAATEEPRVIKWNGKKTGYYVMSPSEANKCRLSDGWTSLTERLSTVEYLRVQIAKLQTELKAAERKVRDRVTNTGEFLPPLFPTR